MTNAIVAAGHPKTVEFALETLRAGGNAFDAAVAALITASTVEPALASLAGGGFLMAAPQGEKPTLIDFFVQTPLNHKSENDLDARSFVCDFGSAQQVFHIGAATSATPGCVKGIFEILDRFGTMTLRDLIQPICEYLNDGVEINEAQAYLLGILTPIFTTDAARENFESRVKPNAVLQPGERLHLQNLKDLLETIAIEGPDLFYRGEVAEQIDRIARHEGGIITRQDLAEYSVALRTPLQRNYRNYQLMLNPPPSVGGIDLAMGFDLLEKTDLAQHGFGSMKHLECLLESMQIRSDLGTDSTDCGIDTDLVHRYLNLLDQQRLATKGTTHISVIDRHANAAALTLSNGEGCGVIIPGTDIMMNNMLGEDDLNPNGLSGWPPNTRLSSMMSPTIAANHKGDLIVTGSGGSNRIPSALQQVLINLIDFDMDCEAAVTAARVHFHNDTAYGENLFSSDVLEKLLASYESGVSFEERNVFFGGAHTARRWRNTLQGAGDPRRAGVCVLA